MRKPTKSVIGLDIGQHTIKVVQATANGQKLRILRAEEIPLPMDISETGATIQRWWEEAHLGQSPVVTQVGGSQVLYQHLKMEAEDPREFSQVARMEAMRFSEMTDAQMEVSVSPASQLKQERDLLLCMARPDLLDMALSPVLKAQLNLVNACPAPVALYNGYIGLGEPIHQPTLFVDLGAHHTEMIIADGQGVRFARSFGLGVSQITHTLAARTKQSFAQADRLRLKARTVEELPAETEGMVTAFVEQWIQEVHACMQLYQESKVYPESPVEIRRMMLCGGGAAWSPLQQEIKSQLDLSVSFPGTLPGLENQSSQSFIIACGLAADGLGIAKASSSLLTPQIRQSLNRKRNKHYWMLTSIFSVATLAMVGAATQISFQREKKQLDRHNKTLQRSDAIRKESENLLANKQEVDKMMSPLIDFVSNSTQIRDLTLFLAQEQEPDDFVTFLGDSESYLQIRLESTEDKERRALTPSRRLALKQINLKQAEELRDARMTRIIVEGFTRKKDLSSVKALIEKLERLPFISRADLLSDDLIFTDPEQENIWANNRYRKFVLDLQLVKRTVSENGAGI